MQGKDLRAKKIGGCPLLAQFQYSRTIKPVHNWIHRLFISDGQNMDYLTKLIERVMYRSTLKRRHRTGLSMTPHEFAEKWNVTPTQFAAVMGLKSAQANRLLANPDASYRQTATTAQTDRLDELDLLMAMRDRSDDRSATLAKVDQLIQAIEILLKLIGLSATDEMMAIGQSMRLDCDLIDNAPSMQRLDRIFSKND